MYTGHATNPRRRLSEHLRRENIPGVKRFRWADYLSVEEAQGAAAELIEEVGLVAACDFSDTDPSSDTRLRSAGL